MIVDYDGRIRRKPTPAPERKSWLDPSTWPHCGPRGTAAGAIISFPICGPMPILGLYARPIHRSGVFPAETGMISPVSFRRRSLHSDFPIGRASSF